MSDTKTTAKTMEEQVMDIAEENILSPTIPVDVSIGEAADLHRYAMEDKEALLARGLDVKLIEEIPARSKFLQDKQSDWTATYQTFLSNNEKWNAKIEEAGLLGYELKHDFQFAFRNNEEALRKLRKITEGSGKSDLMQDMSDYPRLGAEYPAELEAIHFDNSKLERANALSHELFDLRNADGIKVGSNRAEKIMRNRAYTYLKQLVDEIRAYGKYAFWNNEEKQKRYASEYQRAVYKKHQKNKNQPDTLQ